jgi:hypothetical protein
MPCQERGVERQVREANRSSNQLGKKCHARVRLEKFRVVWKKGRMENFQYSRSVNFRIFDGGMVAVNEDRRDGQSGKKQIIFASRPNSIQARASLASAASISSVSAASDSFRP